MTAASEPVGALPPTTHPHPEAGGAGGAGGATGTRGAALPLAAGSAEGAASAEAAALGSGSAEPLADGSGAALESGVAELSVWTMDA